MARLPLLAVVAGLVLRAAWWAYASPAPVSDFEYYRRTAASLLDHFQFGYPTPTARAPLHPVVLATAMLASRSTAWLSFVMVLLSAALVPLAGALAWRLTGRRTVAVTAAWIVALNPTFVFFAPVLASEHLFAVLLVASLVVALGARGGSGSAGATGPARLSPARAAAAGVLLGLAALARADALFYAPIAGALVWWRGDRRRPVGLVACALAAMLAVAPWYVRNRVVIGPGAGLSTAGGLTFYYAHNDREYGWHALEGTPLEGLTELEWQTRGYELGLEYLRRASWRQIGDDVRRGTERQLLPSYPFSLDWSTREPGATPDDHTPRALAGRPTFEHLSGLYIWLVWLAGLSLLLAWRYPPIAAVTLYGGVLMNWIGHCVVFLGEARYRYPAEIFFCLLAALFFAEIAAIVHRLAARAFSRSG